jgi:NAD-dependent SIR2 family protein deacetylase
MQDLRALIDEKLANNRSHREAMFAAIASGEVIAFVGAGLSAPLGFPSWPALLTKLHDRATQLPQSQFNPPESIKADALQYAEEICNHFVAHSALSEFKSILGREYAPRATGANFSLTHNRLVKLPFRTFVTTNYDSCLELALTDNEIKQGKSPCPDPSVIIKKNGQDRHRVSLFLRSIVENTGNHDRHIAHLHGRHDDTENIILTTSDYVESYGVILNGKQPQNYPVTLHRLLVWSLLATRKMVFFGCSMDDPYITVLLNMVARDLWEQGQMSHFVVLPIDEQSVLSVDGLSQQFLRFGLQPVLFDNWSGDFSKLNQLLDEAIEHCTPRHSHIENFSMSNYEIISINSNSASRKSFISKIVSALPKRLAGLFRREQVLLKPVQSGINQEPVNPDWLEEVNTSTVKDLKKNEN